MRLSRWRGICTSENSKFQIPNSKLAVRRWTDCFAVDCFRRRQFCSGSEKLAFFGIRRESADDFVRRSSAAQFCSARRSARVWLWRARRCSRCCEIRWLNLICWACRTARRWGRCWRLFSLADFDLARPILAICGAGLATFTVYQMAKSRAGMNVERLVLVGRYRHDVFCLRFWFC